MFNKNYNPHRRGDVLYSTGTLTFRHFYKTLVLSLFLSCFSFVFVPYIVADANAATNEVSTSATWLPITLSLNTGDDIDFGRVTPSTNNGSNVGTMVVARRQVSLSSTGKSAKVYLSTGSQTSNALDHDSTSLSIPVVNNGTNDGTWNDPVSFAGKGWGFAVPDKTSSNTTLYDTPFATDSAFSSTFNLGVNANSAQLSYGDAGYNGMVWAAVPTLGNEQLIYSITTNNINGFGESGDT